MRLRLWQIKASAITVLVTAWCCTLGPIPAIVALMVAKDVLVAILLMGVGAEATVRALWRLRPGHTRNSLEADPEVTSDELRSVLHSSLASILHHACLTGVPSGIRYPGLDQVAQTVNRISEIASEINLRYRRRQFLG
jgi:hypothetical protein